MHRSTPRRTLLRIGALGVASLAGCLDDGTGSGDVGGPDDDDDPDDGDPNDGNVVDGDDDDPDDTNDDGPDIRQIGSALSGPAWNREERLGFVRLLREQGDAHWLFRDADSETRAFLEETDFEESLLVYVESVGPNACYDEVEFANVAVDDGVLRGEAAAVDTAGADEVCAEVISHPAALYRTRMSQPGEVTEARFTITDGWGESEAVSSEDGVLDPEDLPGYVRPDSDPATVPPALDCDDAAFERHYTGYDADSVTWGASADLDDRPGLHLRVVNPQYDGDDPAEALTFARGDAVRVELTNTAGDVLGTGNHGKYNLEVLTEAGWMDVRGADGAVGYTDELVAHPPGETVEWEFTMTEEGAVADRQNATHLRVCPELQPGRYRFVFWGADDLAVAFDYVG